MDLTFATCTCTVQCEGASDTCPVCDAGHYSTECQGAATYTVSASSTDGSWQIKTGASQTGKQEGDTVTIVLEQKAGTNTDPASDTALAAGKVTVTGLPQGTTATAKLTKAGKTVVAADPAEDQYTKLTITPFNDTTQPTQTELDAIKAMVKTADPGKNSCDGKLYIVASGETAKAEATDSNFATNVDLTGAEFYVKSATAGSTTPGSPAEKGEITITFTMPAANVTISNITVNLAA